MWKPPINFITLHYAYILSCSILAFLIIYAYGNVAAIDAFFFGCSANTESGLNTVDVKALKTYQQLVIYFFPIITNLQAINLVVVVVRLYWFDKRLKKIGTSLRLRRRDGDAESRTSKAVTTEHGTSSAFSNGAPSKTLDNNHDNATVDERPTELPPLSSIATAHTDAKQESTGPAISWAEGTLGAPSGKALRIPSPLERDEGKSIKEVEHDVASENEDDEDVELKDKSAPGPSQLKHRLPRRLSTAATTLSLDRVASSLFVLGDNPQRPTSLSPRRSSTSHTHGLPSLSSQATVGRNSKFRNLTEEDRERLGGIEYRALKLLLNFVIGYWLGIHLLGAICLVPWIHTADAKYTKYLRSQGQDETWWAFYSAQTMVDNLGFTLTPDSMLSFADATWPMLIMTFLAFAGNTCYPVLLRLTIWTFSKIIPKKSSLQEPARFLLDHPRRCYTLLFPSRTTWILFGILFVLNFVDTLLILVLDLHNPAVAYLKPGPRVLAALFQAASSRHTGTSSFNLFDVNPAVQFSLMVMMYISVFPIAFSIRASNTYEERTLGKYAGDAQVEDSQSSHAYLLNHMRNQLSFDLWYIFIGVFCICIAESGRIADFDDPAFSVFSVFFEVVSGYGNVGLSLGDPSVWTSLSGEFSTFSKLVICAMMIRGRHRGLPYALDRAIVMPGDDLLEEEGEGPAEPIAPPEGVKIKRFHTQ